MYLKQDFYLNTEMICLKVQLFISIYLFIRKQKKKHNLPIYLFFLKFSYFC